MGKKMAGTNEFAFFRCKSICTGGGPESGRKNSKNAFRPVPAQKFIFPRLNNLDDRQITHLICVRLKHFLTVCKLGAL